MRAFDFKLLTLVRRVAAFCLSRNLKLCFRWIPSEFNSSDAGSRYYSLDEDHGKDLSETIFRAKEQEPYQYARHDVTRPEEGVYRHRYVGNCREFQCDMYIIDIAGQISVGIGHIGWK